MSNTESISSIDRALELLLLFYNEKCEMGVSEIASILGMHKSTVFRTLATLENRGFAQQNLDNGKYWLGIKLFAIGMLVGEKMSLKQIVQPYADQLSNRFNEVVNVSVLDAADETNPRSIIILKGEGQKQQLMVNPAIGSSNECHCSAVGKCLVAFSKGDILEKMRGGSFPVYTKNTIGSWEDFREEVLKIRERGFAQDVEELEIGFSCIACPILDQNGFAIGAMSLTGPMTRLMALDADEVVGALKETSFQISKLLG